MPLEPQRQREQAMPQRQAWYAHPVLVRRSRTSRSWIAGRPTLQRAGLARAQGPFGRCAYLPCIIYIPTGIARSMEICLREFDLRRRPRYAPRMSILSDNIEALRIHLGDTQTAFAARFGMGQPAVSKWLKSGKVPGTDAMLLLARLAGVSVEDFKERPWSPGGTSEVQTVVMLPVSLPNAAALTRMFEGLLERDVEDDLRDELAQSLARRLPAALARAVDSPAVPVRDGEPRLDEDAQPLARHRQLPRPERRT